MIEQTSNPNRPITYAVVGGPPADWLGLKIIDNATGRQVAGVVEVNTTENWLIRHKPDRTGKPFFICTGEPPCHSCGDLDIRPSGHIASERLEGDFRIERPTANAVRQCRHCGCTDGRACVTAAGPCHWVAADLCSACQVVADSADSAGAAKSIRE